MKTEPRNTQELLRMWSRAPLLTEVAAPDNDRRRELIAHVAATMAVGHEARHRRTLRAIAGALTIAAGVAASWGWHLHETLDGLATISSAAGVAHRVHAGRDVIVTEAAQVAEGDELSTEAGAHAGLVLASATDVRLDETSVVQLERCAAVDGVVDEQVFVRSGRVDVQVPKLRAGGSMRVRTSDALVTVHGTAFSVQVNAPSQPSETRVHVSEGVVSVDNAAEHAVLTAGMSWSSRSNPLTADPGLTPVATHLSEPTGLAPRATASELPKAAAHGQHRSISRQSSITASDPGTLAEQNRAFAEAMATRREGDAPRSAQQLDAFIAHYPDAPLLQIAYVERFCALSHAGDAAAAAREARRYLAAFPRGFAREEALATQAADASH